MDTSGAGIVWEQFRDLLRNRMAVSSAFRRWGQSGTNSGIRGFRGFGASPSVTGPSSASLASYFPYRQLDCREISELAKSNGKRLFLVDTLALVITLLFSLSFFIFWVLFIIVWFPGNALQGIKIQSSIKLCVFVCLRSLNVALCWGGRESTLLCQIVELSVVHRASNLPFSSLPKIVAILEITEMGLDSHFHFLP